MVELELMKKASVIAKQAESSTLRKIEPRSLGFFFASDVLVISRRYVMTLVGSRDAELSCVALD